MDGFSETNILVEGGLSIVCREVLANSRRQRIMVAMKIMEVEPAIREEDFTCFKERWNYWLRCGIET